MNLFYTSLDNRISKFKVYNVHTMADEFMVVSGMPNRIGEKIFWLFCIQISGIINCGIPQSGNNIVSFRAEDFSMYLLDSYFSPSI